MEETKTYEEFKSKVTEQPFYGSDGAYTDDEQYQAESDGEAEFRDDFSLSDTGAQEYVEDVELDDDEYEKKRER